MHAGVRQSQIRIKQPTLKTTLIGFAPIIRGDHLKVNDEC